MITQHIRLALAIYTLKKRGCEVLSAALLPEAVILINQPPAGAMGAWGYRELPGTARLGPVECVATVLGVRVTWWQ